MQKISLYCALTLLVAFSVLDNSCTKKVDGPENNTVVETPFSLFFSDTSGVIYSTNDGKTVNGTLFGSDGAPSRAICVDNNNILWAKTNLLISTNNGVNFNQAFDSLTSYTFKTCDSVVSNLNQSMIIDIPAWGMAFTLSNNPSGTNYLGVVFSLNAGGIRGSWWGDVPDSATVGAYSGNYLITMTSFTYLPSGILCGYDAMHNRNFYRLQNSMWNEVTANPDSALSENVGRPTNHTGIALPHRDVHYTVPSTADSFAWYSYGHLNNRLIAIDNRSCNSGGAYYSDDTGRTWYPYAGLPAAPLTCISSPFEELCLVGTYKAGLYFLNQQTNAFQLQTNNGLPAGIIIRNIAFKQNTYKDGSIAKYIFLATNQGIYESTNGGSNWARTIPGNFVNVY